MKKRFVLILLGLILSFVVVYKFIKPNESISSLDLVLPKSSSKTTQRKNISVSVNKKLQYFVNEKQIPKSRLEDEILAMVDSINLPTITIRSDQDVDLKHVVFIMDIANRNKIKSTLAVKSSN